jgi:hypothetical protein
VNDLTRVAAIKEVLDRGYGRARQPTTAEVKTGPSDELLRIITFD